MKKIFGTCKERAAKIIPSNFGFKLNCKEFWSPYKFSKPFKSEAKRRINENLQYFWLNYLLLDSFIALTIGFSVINEVIPWLLPLISLYFIRRLFLNKEKLYQSCIMAATILAISLHLSFKTSLPVVLISTIFTSLHALYHDYSVPLHNEP